MPLLPGKKNQSKNISEMVRSYVATKKIGNSYPSNKRKAIAQAVAISYQKAGEKK